MPYGWVRSWFPCSIFQRKTKMSKLIAPLSGANFKKQDPFAAGGVTGKSVDLMKSSYNLKSLIANGTIHGGTYEHEVGKAIEKQTGQSAQGALFRVKFLPAVWSSNDQTWLREPTTLADSRFKLRFNRLS